MLTVDSPPTPSDLVEAIGFAERRFTEWQEKGGLTADQLSVMRERYVTLRQKAEEANRAGDEPILRTLPCPQPGESPTARSLRFWIFLQHEIQRFADNRILKLAQSHDLLAEVSGRQSALERKLTPGELPEVVAVNPAGGSEDDFAPRASRPARPPASPRPQQNMLEILLDPRNIQWLLVFGGALMIVGVVILLWMNDFFTPQVTAIGLGIANAAALLLGWVVLRTSRYQTAGRALTMLACMVMPLNLWYYHANGLILIERNLWVPALVISVLYFASALVLRDKVFVYVFCAGITLTGLLILAGIEPSPQKFWEIASPASLLVVLGLLGIHLERAFPNEDGPFSRKGFGLAFFWSGHVQLAAGLLLLLGATIAGDWLFAPVFQAYYKMYAAEPSPVVGDQLRWLAIALVAAGTYAYIYSDLVVRHVGVYVYVAAATLLWMVVLLIEQFHLHLGLDALVAILAGLALVINLCEGLAFKQSKYTRSLPILGVLLPLLAVLLGVFLYLRNVSPDLRNAWQAEKPTWGYLGAMVLTAVSCRVGAFVYRNSQPALSAVYFFATAAATLTGAAALLAMIGLGRWEDHGPILMLLPIAYLVAAQFYKGKTPEHPLVWVSHAATGVLLVSALTSAVTGFTVVVEKQHLNLMLALFFAEAAVYYGLTAALRRQAVGVHLCALMACGTVWQLFTYAGVQGEIYTLVFALVGVGLLLAYRLALVERVAGDPLANAAFQAGNVLVSLSFVASALMGLGRLTAGRGADSLFIGLCGGLTLISLLALALVRQMAWRRWYVVTSIAEAGLTFLCFAMLITLSPMQKVEVFSVGVGLLLLVVGHVGWYAEKDRENDLVTLALVIGSLMVGLPLAIATIVDRSQNQFIAANEFGFLIAGIVLLTTGFFFQLKSTTIIGAFLSVLYFVTLLVYVPWSRLNAIAMFLAIGGGSLFTLGLILSVFRDRLLTLPERVKRREGLFRVLAWR